MEELRAGEIWTRVAGKSEVTSVMEVPSLLQTMLYNGKRYLYVTTIFDVKKALVACTKFNVSQGTDKSDFIITYQKMLYIMVLFIIE